MHLCPTLAQGGVELSFIVAVDYTGSNGDPRNPQSLHYYSQQPTMYEGEPLGLPHPGTSAGQAGTRAVLPAG